jgi:osmotically inducible protein OsmC
MLFFKPPLQYAARALRAVGPGLLFPASNARETGAAPSILHDTDKPLHAERTAAMPVRKSSAEWKGTLKDGAGKMKLGSGAYEGPYTFASRFESGNGTNPEELIGAAHAGCFSMFLSALLTKAGFAPTRISTQAIVHLGEGPVIGLIELETEAQVAGINEATLQEHAENAKRNCPVARALTGPEIRLKVKLVQ